MILPKPTPVPVASAGAGVSVRENCPSVRFLSGSCQDGVAFVWYTGIRNREGNLKSQTAQKPKPSQARPRRRQNRRVSRRTRKRRKGRESQERRATESRPEVAAKPAEQRTYKPQLL